MDSSHDPWPGPEPQVGNYWLEWRSQVFNIYKNSNKIHAQELEIKKGCTGTVPDVQTKTRLFNVANLYVCVFCVPKEK